MRRLPLLLRRPRRTQCYAVSRREHALASRLRRVELVRLQVGAVGVSGGKKSILVWQWDVRHVPRLP